MKKNGLGYNGAYGRAIGDENRKVIWDFVQKTPNATVRRTAAATGISTTTVLKAFQAFKHGWTPASMGEKK